METFLQRKIEDDLKEALKSGNSKKVSTLRLISASIHNREIEKRSKTGDRVLTDEEILEVLNREAKKRKEAIEIYLKNGRGDLAQGETEELGMIEVYLPRQLTEEELGEFISEVIISLGSNPKDFGRIMGEVMKLAKGRADGRRVGEMIKKRISE
ncbi:GatB/YqeY domain-containing protein [Candidatus Wolfebacteria bacterium]|nr:GatB/YqeY domain-containing protein [Candidatus Wolfebacteria bacterium]